ncbi:MAG: electron transfer flavoprotein subunit beta/FixA family protein [Ilumatobacteraceae bacterium]
MRVLVCVKRVPAPGSKINITADGQQVDTASLGFTMSPHEECAVEAGAQLVEQHGGEATVLTLGSVAAEEQVRYAVSVGMQNGVVLPITDDEWDPQRTAEAITAAVRELETADGPFDLILFGNESADSGGFQVGVRVAYALGRAMVNGAKGLTVTDGTAHVEREADAGRETYELPMPAVVGVKEGINLPRYPTMKGRLASKKAHVTTIEPAGSVGGLAKVSLQPPPERKSETILLGTGPDAAAAVVDVLEEIGVL